MSRPPAQHLAEILAETGDADGTRDIVSLVTRGLQMAREATQAERRAQGKELKTHGYVTDAGKECDRQVVYSLMNVPESDPITTDSLVNFAVGSAVEEAFATMLEPLGATVLRELHVEFANGVTGRADFLIALVEPTRTTRRLIELKTTNSRSMGWILKRGKAQPTHIHQANLYLHGTQLGLLQDDKGQLLPFSEAFVTYIVKDAVIREPPVHAFKVPYDQLMAESDLEHLSFLQQRANEKDLPPRPPAFEWGKFPCAWCSHRATCWDEEGK